MNENGSKCVSIASDDSFALKFENAHYRQSEFSPFFFWGGGGRNKTKLFTFKTERQTGQHFCLNITLVLKLYGFEILVL